MTDIITYLLIVLKVCFLLVIFYLGLKSYYAKQQKVTLVFYLFLYYIFVTVLFAAEEFYFHSIMMNYYVVTLSNMG